MHPGSSQVIALGPQSTTDPVDARAKWFAIQTKPRNEEKALCFLSRKSIPTFLPRLMVRRRHGSRTWQALEPLFPGYLFGRFVPEAEVIDKVRWTPGISRILGAEGEPVPVPEDFIAHLWERLAERGYVTPAPNLLPGTRVRFKGGPFALLEAVIDRPASRVDRVRVLLGLLNLHVSVEVDIDYLEHV